MESPIRGIAIPLPYQKCIEADLYKLGNCYPLLPGHWSSFSYGLFLVVQRLGSRPFPLVSGTVRDEDGAAWGDSGWRNQVSWWKLWRSCCCSLKFAGLPDDRIILSSSLSCSRNTFSLSLLFSRKSNALPCCLGWYQTDASYCLESQHEHSLLYLPDSMLDSHFPDERYYRSCVLFSSLSPKKTDSSIRAKQR